VTQSDDGTHALDTARVRAHLELVPLATASSAAVAVFLVAVQWAVVDRRWLIGWLALVLAALAGRVATVIAHRRVAAAHPPAWWLTRLRAAYAAHALAWGSAGPALFPSGDVPHQAFLIFALGGMSVSALTLTAFDLTAGVTFLAAVLIPLIARMLAEGAEIQTTMAMILSLFVALIAANAARAHRGWLAGVQLNVDLERLVEERTGALRASEERFRHALDAANDGLWDVDLESREVYYSPVWGRVLGFDPTEITPTPEFFWGRLHPDDRAHVEAATAAHRDGHTAAMEVEVRLRCKDGSYRWFLNRGKVVAHGADGRPRRMVGAITDITERRHALENLAESEARFRAVFDQGPIALSLVRVADDRFVEVNDAGLAAMGHTRQEVIGHSALELGLWADVGERERTLAELTHHGAVKDVEVRMRRKNGDTFWGLFSSSSVRLGGEPYRLSTLQDITERRQLEARFLQSQKMEVLGHLAGGVAHDFNNVLTVIHSTAELALPITADASLQDALETIRDASARASGLTSQLLAFSRRQILQPTTLDLNEVVRDLTPMLRRAIGERIALETRPANRAATILADRSSVEQVLLNLAINARDAMADGGTLTVAIAVTQDASPRQIELTISDTGVGMNESTRERVFEPFFTTKDAGKGTGLGLSTAHGIVTQSGGEISVRSTPGVGSTFTITLPLIERPPDRMVPGRRGVVGGHETILVVDDDADIRDVVRRALASAGYQVLLSANGDDALRLLSTRRGQVQLLLTDVVMPGLSGPDLAERVHHDHPSVRILYSSGFVDAAAEGHAGLGTGAPFIAKPYSLKALTQKVRDVLDA
jgi:two-component system, cell cycle sensor histidine kinase and response regulator CckA